jgi:hypothetical protein
MSEFSLVDPDCVERKSWFVATGLLSGMLKSVAYDAANKRILHPMGDRFFLHS